MLSSERVEFGASVAELVETRGCAVGRASYVAGVAKSDINEVSSAGLAELSRVMKVEGMLHSFAVAFVSDLLISVMGAVGPILIGESSNFGVFTLRVYG